MPLQSPQQSRSLLATEVRPPGIAKYVATSKSKSELAELPDELPDEAGRSWPRAYSMTSACLSAVTKSVGEARPPGFVTAESEPQSLLMKTLLPRKMKLDLLGPEQVARPEQPQQQQSQSLLVKFDLLCLRSAQSPDRIRIHRVFWRSGTASRRTLRASWSSLCAQHSVSRPPHTGDLCGPKEKRKEREKKFVASSIGRLDKRL